MITLAAAFLLLGEVTAEIRIPAGTVIEPAHISGQTEDTAPLIGRQATRTIFPGRTIKLADTQRADLVSRNDMIRIIARKGPLTVETKGRALGAGAEGDGILIMNLDSRRTLSGVIIGPGVVEVSI